MNWTSDPEATLHWAYAAVMLALFVIGLIILAWAHLRMRRIDRALSPEVLMAGFTEDLRRQYQIQARLNAESRAIQESHEANRSADGGDDPSDLIAMNLGLPMEMLKQLQLQSSEEGRPMNDVVVDAIHDYLWRSSGPAR